MQYFAVHNGDCFILTYSAIYEVIKGYEQSRYDEYLEIEENGTVKKYKCLKNARKTIESTATNGKAYAEAMECLAWKVLCNHTVAKMIFPITMEACYLIY